MSLASFARPRVLPIARQHLVQSRALATSSSRWAPRTGFFGDASTSAPSSSSEQEQQPSSSQDAMFRSNPKVGSRAPFTASDVQRQEDPLMQLPTAELNAEQLNARWKLMSDAASATRARHDVHSGYTPVTSRTEALGSQSVATVQQAWRRLHRTLAESGIRKELRMTARYERPTFKRQRLASERHRRRFKNEVVQQISSIMRLKKKGL